MTPQRSRGGSAALWGIIIGLMLAVLVALHQLVFVRLVQRELPHGALIYSALALLVGAVLYFLAGVLAARRANAIEAGLFAGLIAGIIAGATALAVTLIVLALRPPLVVRHPALLRAEEVTGIVREALGIVVQALIGAGLGALGGLAGRRSPPAAGANNPTTQPAYPAYPAYPATPQSPPQPPNPYAYPPATPPLGDDTPTVTPRR